MPSDFYPLCRQFYFFSLRIIFPENTCAVGQASIIFPFTDHLNLSVVEKTVMEIDGIDIEH